MSLEWLRQGKSIAETKELLRSTMALSKLGNLESAESTEYLTSILNGFNKEAKEAEDVVDKLVAVDNRAATSAGELATALKYSSAVAGEAGISFERLTAMATVISENTRMSGEVIGQALKTIITRMQAVAANKSVDEFGDSLNNVESSLREVGIELRDSTDSFRPLGDVLDEINSKWDTFGETEQKKISGAIAGVRQINILTSLMQNYGDVQKYMTIQNEAAGLSQERYKIYLEGVEAAQNRLTSSVEKFWQDAISSGNVATFYNFLAGLVDLAGNVLPSLETAIVAVGVVMTLYYQKEIENALFAVGNYIKSTWALVAAKYAEAKAIGVAATAQNLLNATNPVGWIAIAIGVIYGIVKAYQTWGNTIENVNKKLEEQKKVIEEIKNAQREFNKGIPRLLELGDKGTSRTSDEQSEFIDLQNKLKELIPAISGYYDDYGNFVIDLAQDFDKLNSEMDENYKKEAARQQQLADQSAQLQANKILAEYAIKLENVDGRLDRRTPSEIGFADEESFNKIKDDFLKNNDTVTNSVMESWNKARDSAIAAFEKMSDEGRQAFIDTLMSEGENGKKLAEEFFIPLMNKIDEVKDRMEGDPIQVPIKPVVSDDAKKAFDEIIEMTMDMIKQKKEAEKDALEDELDNLEKLADSQKEIYDDELESIKRNAEEAKRAIDDEYREQKRLFDARKTAIENELEDYKKIIDAERDRLKAQKERNDYERSLQENTEDLASLEAQIAELALDNSAEAIAKRKELESQAAELRKKMAEEQDDFEYNLQLEALEREESAAENETELLLRQLELEEKAAEDRHERMLREIEDAVYEAEQRHEILIRSVDEELAYKKEALEKQIKDIDEYLKQEGTIRNDALKLMKEDNQKLYEELLEWNKKYGSGIDADIIALWKRATDAVNEYRNVVVALPPPPSPTGGSGSNLPPPNEQEFEYHNYHSGGVVGGGMSIKSNEQFAKLMKGEIVVNSSQMERFMKQTLPSMFGQPTMSTSNTFGGVNISMPIEVKGNLDKSVLPDMEKLMERVVQKLNNNLMSRGMNRRADAFSI